MEIPDFGSDLVSVVLRTAIVYVCLVLGFRIFGKREAGQLSTLDLVVLLVIANAVQNAMVGQNTTLAAGLVAAFVILALDRGLHALTNRSKVLHDTLEGEPALLVEDGRILEDHLRHEGISLRELGVALRQSGLLTAEEARFVFLETNGQISVIPRHAHEDETSDPEVDPDRPDEPVDEGDDDDGHVRRRRRRPGHLSGTST